MPVDLSNHFLQTLHGCGLVVCKTVLEGEHDIIKPASAGGNSIPGLEIRFKRPDGTEDVTNAPVMGVRAHSSASWELSVHWYIPWPGPGDFIEGFDDESAAIAAVLDYYFGDSGHFRTLLQASQQAQ